MIPASIFGTIGSLLGPVLGVLHSVAIVAVPLVGAAIAGAITDSHRRELIREVAQGAAALAILKFPNVTNDQLVREIVDLIMASPNPPTTNRDVLARAAASAVATAKLANVTNVGATHPGA